MVDVLKDNESPLITVIIPVFNIKLYLKKCVESVVSQSYCNLEIILVDDGSTDGSEVLCDMLANTFTDVKAFHKENGGLASARNYGVNLAKGKYIVFVDSDDYVDEEYVQYLWDIKRKFNADIAISGYVKEKLNGNIINVVKSPNSCLLTGKDAIEKMCYGNELPIMAYGKLFNKRTLIKFPFPDGKMHEDVGVMYMILDTTNKVALGKKATYHYIQREGSIVNQNYRPSHLYSLEASENIIEYIRKKYPTIIEAGYARLAIESVALTHRAINASKKEYKFLTNKIRLNFKNGLCLTMKNKKLPVRTRVQLFTFFVSPEMYRELYKFLKSLKRSGK